MKTIIITIIRTVFALCLLATTSAALRAQSYNATLGQYALNPSTTGSYNHAIGYYSLYANTSGGYNNAIGAYALRNNTIGYHNNAFGYYALYSNTSGGYNTALGMYALYFNSTGSYNIGLGYQAGRYIANGSTANATASNSIFLGRDTKSLTAGQTNEVVIGYNATGNGSNSVTLGSDAITKTVLKGNVGIGTTAPLAKLHVNSGINSYAAILATSNEGNNLVVSSQTTQPTNVKVFSISHEFLDSNRNNGSINFYRGTSAAGGFLTFGSNGLERMRINTDGNVGIGTTTPTSKLDVNGNARILGDIWGSQVLTFQNNARFTVTRSNVPTLTASSFSMPYYGVAAPNVGGSADLWISGNGGIRMFTNGNPNPLVNILSNGNVGIGTTTPNAKLDVNGNIRAVGEVTSSRNNVDIGGALIVENPAKTGAGQASSWNIYNMGGIYGNSLQFWAYDNVGCVSGGLCAPRLVIMDNGNVGIGTSNPQYMLDVKGKIRGTEIRVEPHGAFPDFVFKENYNLRSLKDIQSFINENGHLPEIPTAGEVEENGINIAEMQAKLLQKIEELTLYIIQQGEKIEELENKLNK
jgi:hypothetical protein